MMVRLAALALQAHQLASALPRRWHAWRLAQACPTPTSPTCWLRDFTGRTRLWVEVGQPEDKPVIKACGKADAVVRVLLHHAAEVWWRGMESKLGPAAQPVGVSPAHRRQRRRWCSLPSAACSCQATVQEGVLTLGNSAHTVDVETLRWM